MKNCTVCNGNGVVEEYNFSAVMMGIAILGAPIPVGGGYFEDVECAHCSGTGKVEA